MSIEAPVLARVEQLSQTLHLFLLTSQVFAMVGEGLMNDAFELIDFLADGCHGIWGDAESAEEEENAEKGSVGWSRFVKILWRC
jgi:hypothetical protein